MVASMGWTIRKLATTGDLYVSWLDPKGAAAKAGIERFDRIVSTGRTALQLNTLAEPATFVVEHRGETRTIDITPLRDGSAPLPVLQRFGEVAVIQYPSGMTSGGAQAVHDLVSQAIAEKARGIVLDLRDNGGGGIECGAAGGAFLDYTTKMTDRAGASRVLTVSKDGARMDAEDVEALELERPARWPGPMAILVNQRTASCAEALAIEASLAHRAVIVGEPSAGVGNNVVAPVALPDGWRMMMAVAYATDTAGKPLPSRPAIDFAVADDPIAIGLSGQDLALDAAMRALKADPAQ